MPKTPRSAIAHQFWARTALSAWVSPSGAAAVGVELGALGAVVSGSGPTCAFLSRSREAAVRLAAALAGAGVCRTVRVAYGPVPGARIVADDEGGP